MAAIGFGNPYTNKRLQNLYFNAPAPQTISAPKRTLGDIVRDGAQTVASKVLPQRTARKLADLVDFTPVGAVAQAFDAGADLRKGNYLQGAIGALSNMIPDGGKLGGAVAHSIIAPLFHGSPHKFEKFALDKIGTGEGAQAYGHGLYFAENPSVAKEYRDRLADDDNYQIASGGSWSPDYLEHPNIRVTARRNGENLQASLDYAREILARPNSEMARAAAAKDLATLQEIAAKGGVQKSTGHLYEVKLDANPEDFLDWDAPLKAQSSEVLNRLPVAGLFKGAPPEVLGRMDQPGSFAYHNMVATNGGSYAGPRVASPALAQAGIPGIRYLDQGSRGAGNGTRNYVVFDPSIIDITGRR